MKIPPSTHFVPIALQSTFNIDRQQLTGSLKPVTDRAFGSQAYHGIPFELGLRGQPNVILLDEDAVHIQVDDVQATYLLFLHAVEDRGTPYPDGLEDFDGNILRSGGVDGNALGQVVSEYSLEYTDGTSVTVPILRRFAIQQSRITWGASPFAAIPAAEDIVYPLASEAQQMGQPSAYSAGRAETRHRAGRDMPGDHLWIYALPNPHPEQSIRQIVCVPQEERSLIYAISYTDMDMHPLRRSARQKLKLTLPEGAQVNDIEEFEGIDIDLGTVISARVALDYDRESWFNADPDVQPCPSDAAVIVEYQAHPLAKLYVSTDAAQENLIYDLADLKDDAITPLNPTSRPVHLRIVEKGSGQPVPVRLHLHGQAGDYLPPRGHHRKVNPYWFEDQYGEFVNGRNQYCYVHGTCEVELPLGEVFVEISRGYEVKPIRTSVMVTPETDEITFELERVLHWREQGWVTADTHVHFLSPQTALLEGQAEGVNVVNVLASQWGEMFSNVADFDGKTTIGAKALGGDGEFFVRVGTENRMQVLGHISLLGYAGAMIVPLCSGGPTESAIGDAQEITMAEWAQRCIDQGGLVVMPHAPNPQAERAADIVLGLVHAIEMMTFNPFDAQINPYGLADWYRYLNLGYHLPVVGGSDKMTAASLLGGVRTYAHLGQQLLTYENWMAAVQAGNTFVTVGPLAELTVEGLTPGQRLELPATGGTVSVLWRVESVSLPIDRVEVVVGGLMAEQTHVENKLSASGETDIRIDESTWIALRVRGSYHGKHGEIAAHTSAVQVMVGGKPIFSQNDATAVLEQIEGAIAYVDTLATRPDARRYKQIRATLEAAHNRLHQQMHRNGIYHRHYPLHDHTDHHEH